MDEKHLEEVAKIMGILIKERKIRGWGLASPTVEQLKKSKCYNTCDFCTK
jgi:hypothetical protein